MKSCTCDSEMTLCRELHRQAVFSNDPEIRETTKLELIRKFEKLAYYIIRHRLGNINENEMEDLFHDIVLQWLTELPNWSPDTKLCVWCSQQADRCVGKARRQWKKRAKENRVEHDIPDETPHIDSDTILCFEQTISRFRSDKQVVIRQFLEGSPIQEIASRVERTRQIVRIWLNEMFAKLVKCLKNE